MLRVRGGEKLPPPAVIETPSFGLNYILGGGFLGGRFHIIWGTPQGGKTSVLLHTLAVAQEQGYVAVVVDAEGSYTDEWAIKCGLDLDRREYIRSNTLEQISSAVVPMLKEDRKYAVMIDSINAIESESYYKNPEGSGALGTGARVRRRLFQNLSEYLHPQNNIVFMVSQQTMNLGAHHVHVGAKIGKAEEHWATNIIKLFASSSKDALERGENELIINKEIWWMMRRKDC